jgi:hypothetical protein
VDAALVEQMMAAGRLPRLAELKARGGYSPLTPTVPAQTPVSWATFSTGLDPGGTQIFDFLKRDPANRIPTFAVAEETTAPADARQAQRAGRGRRGGAHPPAARPRAAREAPAHRGGRPRAPRSRRRRGRIPRRPRVGARDAAVGQEQPQRAGVLGGDRRLVPRR